MEPKSLLPFDSFTKLLNKMDEFIDKMKSTCYKENTEEQVALNPALKGDLNIIQMELMDHLRIVLDL